MSLDLHRTVINRGIDLCESREDCFYILDCVSAHNQPGRVDDAVQQVSTIDSNYCATYYPWVKIIDPATNVLQPYPPSALMMSVYASNDKSAAEWFAPAGLNRGGIESAVTVMDRLNFAERDQLYEGKVNPIAAFMVKELLLSVKRLYNVVQVHWTELTFVVCLSILRNSLQVLQDSYFSSKM